MSRMKCVVKAKRRLANGIARLQIEAAGEEREGGGGGCRIGMDVVARLATSIDIGTHLLVERDVANDEARRRAKMSARYTTIAARTASTASTSSTPSTSSTSSTASTSRPTRQTRQVFASAGGLLLRIAAEEGSPLLASLREGTTFTLSLFDAS